MCSSVHLGPWNDVGCKNLGDDGGNGERPDVREVTCQIGRAW